MVKKVKASHTCWPYGPRPTRYHYAKTPPCVNGERGKQLFCNTLHSFKCDIVIFQLATLQN